MTTLQHRIPLSDLPALPASGRHGLRVRARNPAGAGEPSTRLHARPVERTEVLRSRVNGEWVDTGTLAVANALQILRARATANETDTVSQGIRIDALRAEVGENLATAVDSLSARVEVNEDDIEVNADALTALSASLMNYATVTALNSLSTQLSQVDGRVTANAAEISAVEAAFGGRTLGPAQNVFTGADKAAAELARDTYATANPTWLADYDADNDINIELRWGVLYVYQRRLNNAWVDNGEALARAAAVTMLNAMVTEHDGELTSLARWNVQTAVGDLVGGIGLLNDGTDVKLTIVADKFSIIPASTSLQNRAVPFVIDANGRVVIANAMIGDATITAAKIGDAFLDNLTAVHGTLAFANIDKGDIFDLTVGNVIASSNFATGSAGWRITRTGDAEFDAASIRGTLSAAHIAADVQNWIPLWRGAQDIGTTAVAFSLAESTVVFTDYAVTVFYTLTGGVQAFQEILMFSRGTNTAAFLGFAGDATADDYVVIDNISAREIQLRTESGAVTIGGIWGVQNPLSLTPPVPTPGSIPTPTGVAATATQLSADATTGSYYVTFEYDDNPGFFSPSKVFDNIESTIHETTWTPPSGLTYIRARFTTESQDGGDQGDWSATATYGTAPTGTAFDFTLTDADGTSLSEPGRLEFIPLGDSFPGAVMDNGVPAAVTRIIMYGANYRTASLRGILYLVIDDAFNLLPAVETSIQITVTEGTNTVSMTGVGSDTNEPYDIDTNKPGVNAFVAAYTSNTETTFRFQYSP